MSEQFYIGWDVGAWHCDHNKTSRDAIVILDNKLQIVGKPWRGNLRDPINKVKDMDELFNIIYDKKHCDVVDPTGSACITMAIDTPLGFSIEFKNLITKNEIAADIKEFTKKNPYLFRHTERFISKYVKNPLSAIQDQIGSQATKGIHVLAKFGFQLKSWGVWENDKKCCIIETYPAACKGSKIIEELTEKCCIKEGDKGCSEKGDIKDALTCALMAYLYKNKLQNLEEPQNLEKQPASENEKEKYKSEGWIWVPKDHFPKV